MSSQLVFGFIRGLHDLATVVWIGGFISLGLVMIPSARAVLAAGPERKKLMKMIHRRSRVLALISMALLLVTGVLLAKQSPNFLGLFSFGNAYSILLSVKHILVLVIIGIALFRNRLLEGKGKPSGKSRQKLNLWLLYLNIFFGSVIVILSGFSAAF